MPRWTSFALMAATAMIAAPVGTHYLSQARPIETRLVQHAPASVDTTAATKNERNAKNDTTAGQSDQLLAQQQDALEQAKIDLAGTVCGSASKRIDAKSHGCDQSALEGAEIMLAVLPDPVHTELALRFDRGVDDIENELVQLGWIYDRSWLPWDNVVRKGADRWQDRRMDDHMQRAVEALPGVLVFRRSNETQKQPLIVLLVGDAPTYGVNSEQFFRAIDLWRQPCGLIHQPCTMTAPASLAIFGPTFTGSVPSLHRLLTESLLPLCAGGQPLSVVVSSGTVSNSNALETMPALCRSISVHQETFAVDASYLAAHLYQYSGANLANVSERETSYGGRAVFRDSLPAIPEQKERLLQYQQYRATLNCTVNLITCAEVDRSINRLQHSIATAQAGPSKKSRLGREGIMNLTFPRGISGLRRAYEQNGIVGFAQATDAPKTQLQLSSGGDEDNDDTVTNYSGSLAVLSMEAEMANLAKTLVIEHIDAILLSASDVMDEIFVARYLQQHAPDVTVVVNDADLLFLREGQDLSLQNVYIISVWPLTERNIRWSDTAVSDWHVFSSQGDQGTSEAIQHLVCVSIFKGSSQGTCNPDAYREARPPFIVDGATNDNKLQPPLWLSVVGHGGFMPVSLLDMDDISQQVPELSELSLPRLQPVRTDPKTGDELPAPFQNEDIDESNSLPLKVMATLLLLLLLWHGMACIRCRIDRPFAWTYARAERQQDELRLCLKAALSVVGMLTLSLLYLPDQHPLAHGAVFRVESFPFHLLLGAGMILAALLSSLSIWKAVQVRALRRQPPPQLTVARNVWQSIGNLLQTLVAYPRALVIASIYFAVLVSGIALVHWNVWRLFAPSIQYPSEKTFFIYRASQPLSGASPLLPLLLMAAVAAVWLHGIFSQLAFFGHRIPKLPDHFEGIRCPSNGSVRGLNQLLSRPMDVSRIASFVACLLVAGLAIRLAGEHGVETFSHGWFGHWISLATWIFSAAILQDLLTATRAWQQLRHRCLIPLKQSPLRWGFTWVKGFSWKRIWTSSKNLSSNQVFDYLLRLLETNERAPQDAAVKTCYTAVYQHYYAEPKGEVWLKDFTSKTAALHKRVKKAAEQRLADLQAEWAKDAGPLTGTEEVRGIHMLQKLEAVEQPDLRAAMLKRMGSEEFVALLYVGYISMVLIQIRHRIVRAAMMYILLMWALTCYPWMYRHTILIELSALLIVLSGVTIYVYSQMHRDEILSRTTETETGKLDSGFFEKVIPVIGLPLLTLIASQFPEFSNLIFSWLQPGLSHMQ